MAAATYTVEIDFAKNGTYTHGSVSTNVTGYVLAMSWNNGMRTSYDELAQPAQLDVVLDNTGGQWSPENSGSSFYGLFTLDLLVRIKATYAAVTSTLYTGKIRAIRVATGAKGKKAVTITAMDAMLEILDSEFTPALLESVTADVAIAPIFDGALVLWPYASTTLILDAATSVLDTSTLYSHAVTNFETGKTTFAYTGDIAENMDAVSALGFIKDMIAGEAGGRFWFNTRTGKFTFHNRHHDLLNSTVVYTLTGADFEPEPSHYISGEEIANHTSVTIVPRKVGDVGTIIWQMSTQIALGPNEEKVFTIYYQIASSDVTARVGCKTLYLPHTYTANTAADGSGTDVTNQIGMYVVTQGNSGVLTLKNNTPQYAYMLTLQVRGTPLIMKEEVTKEKSNPSGIVSYGTRPARAVRVRAISDEGFADDYAGWLLAKYKTIIHRFESITFIANKSVNRMTRGLAAVIGTRITLSDSSINHAAVDYIIVGERHQVIPGGEHTHTVTWILKHVGAVVGMRLDITGLDELDGTATVLVL